MCESVGVWTCSLTHGAVIQFNKLGALQECSLLSRQISNDIIFPEIRPLMNIMQKTSR